MSMEKKEEQKDPELNDRLLSGEAWVWCLDCNAKLAAFDGNKDKAISCPTPKKCREERR